MVTSHSQSGSRHTGVLWDGKPLPCLLRVVVYQGGQVAALGIRATDPACFPELLKSADFESAFPELLRQEIHAEMAWHGIDTGIKEEAIGEAVDEFISLLREGSDKMVSRKIAEGERPEAGADASLEYRLNPDGFPRKEPPEKEQHTALSRTHEVRAGQTLVVRRPPASAKPGITVRGEPVPATVQRRDESLLDIRGLNTEVVDEERLVSAIDGVYREDMRGKVRVVQELEVDEVNAVTGDLPKSGVAAVNVVVRKGVAHGSAVHTTEDVFIGTPKEAGTLEAGCSIRARNLVVRGSVLGSGVPEAYLTGEMDALEQPEQVKVRSDLEASRIEVEAIFAARELMGRNVSAGTALVQATVHGSALEVVADLQVDGDLVGGLVMCGGMVEILGDMGNEEGTPTRVRLELEGPQEKRRTQLKTELVAHLHKVERLLAELEEHRKGMELCARRSSYWAALLAGEKRPPARPMERKLLTQFLQSAKQRKQLEQDVYDAQVDAKGLERVLKEGGDEESADSRSAVRVLVGGTVYPGASLEMVRPLEPEDADRVVKDRAVEETTIADVRAGLADQVERYIALYEESVDERKEALDKMFEGREARPDAPTIPDKKFESTVSLASEGETAGRGALLKEGAVYVHAHEPTSFYLKQMARITMPVQNAAISLEQLGDRLEFGCAAGQGNPTPWQQDGEILSELEEIWVAGFSARRHLLD